MPSTPPARTLSAIRQDIDQIDQELLGLLLRRWREFARGLGE